MRNLKARYIWISVAVSFILGCVLVFAVTQTSGGWTTFMIVLMAIDFIYMTIAIQIAATKSFRYKAKPKHYKTKSFLCSNDHLNDLLKKNGYQPRKVSYGISYLKVLPPFAYKVVLIEDSKEYFNPEKEEQKNFPQNKLLEKCKQFIGCEIFLDYDEDTLKKLPDFNLQGDHIYYCGYYKENDKLICPNYIEPKEAFSTLLDTIKQDLELEEDIPA